MIIGQAPTDEARQADLCDLIKRFLAAQHYASFRKLDVTIVGDSVILVGSLPSFHERQLAVSICQHVAGVRRVVDRLVVPASAPTDGSTVAGARSVPSPRDTLRRDRPHRSRGPYPTTD